MAPRLVVWHNVIGVLQVQWHSLLVIQAGHLKYTACVGSVQPPLIVELP